MESNVRKNILFAPAWYPCSFFEEQQEVYANEYNIYNIVGNCSWLPKKKQLRRLIELKGLSQVDTSINGNLCSINIICPKYKSAQYTAQAIQKVADKVGSAIMSLIGGKKPDYVYLQSISDLAIFVVDWAKRNDVKVILAEHLIYIRHSVNYISHRKEQLYSLADKVFCVSNYLYRNLLTSGFSMKSVSVVGNLVSNHGIPEDWTKTEKNGRIMFVAGHFADKDMPTFFAVAECLQTQNINIDVFGLVGDEIFGDKPLKEYVGHNVTFMGKLSHNELLNQYSSYSLLLSTSVSETFGLSVAEAIAHGIPVVCTDSGGVRDFVNEENGIVVPIKDTNALVTAIGKIMSTKCDCKHISQQILDKYGYHQFKKNVSLEY